MRRSHRACLLSAGKKFFWKKYTIIYQEGITGSESTTLGSTTQYYGTTYDFNPNTGVFTVDQTTSRSRTAVLIGDCFISLTTTSGTQTGTIVNVVTGRATSSNSYTLTYNVISAIPKKDIYIKKVSSKNIQDYPINGVKDGYWYVFYNEEINYTGDYLDEVAIENHKYCRILTFTSSGILTINKAVTADIWLCGGGGGGGNANGNANFGGGGGYAVSTNNINIKNITIIIGSGGSSDIAGGQSSISGDISLTADGGYNGSGNSSAHHRGEGGSGGGGYDQGNGGSGDGFSKLPFDSVGGYFSFPYCDGGGGGGRYLYPYSPNGGVGGTNGGDGGKSSSGTGLGGAGGGHYGGKGGDGTAVGGSTTGVNATGYGSGGGGSGYDPNSTSTISVGGSGYQGVCFIRSFMNIDFAGELPYGYHLLDYIQSDGNQYIDTDIIPGNNISVELDFALTSDEAGSSSTRYLFGTNQFRFAKLSSYYRTYGDGYSNIGTVDANRHIVIKTPTLTTFKTSGSADSTASTTAGTPTLPLALFAVNDEGSYLYPCSMKVYSFKIYDNNILIRNMVPCISNEGYACLFDTVNSLIYRSIGTSDFIPGNVIS